MYTKHNIIEMLNSQSSDMERLFARGVEVRNSAIGDGVYLRGLIEYSNICSKDCLYCGIRSSNREVERYVLTETQVLDAAKFAYESNYGSVVLQCGEVKSERHITLIEHLVKEMKKLSNGTLGITLSMGEQTLECYQRWFDAGAHRYLLRIESSNRDLYNKIHPNNPQHSYDERIMAIENLRSVGFQVGSGVMIGLPYQSVEDLADDLLWMKRMDIDMCGMGPYLISEGAPFGLESAHLLKSEQWRFETSLKMIAILRILMPKINIAASTALQAINPMGRIKAIECGANIIMPNISPENIRANYNLYNNKPRSFDSKIIEDRVHYGEWGDSSHFNSKKR